MTDLTHQPTAEDFRALARSSPWLFRTLHLTHRLTGESGRQRPGSVEAWLDRPSRRLTVQGPGGVEVAMDPPYATSGPVGPAREPLLRADGLVRWRPPGWAYDHGDPMWGSYLWTAMLDPAELADGAWTDAEHERGLSTADAVPPPGVALTEVEEVELRGRRTWRAVCAPLLHRYDPRCGCCPLLDGLASRLLEYGPEDPTLGSPREDLPTAYLVSLDVQTEIVVDVTPLDGSGAGTSLVNEIHGVDQPLHPPAG